MRLMTFGARKAVVCVKRAVVRQRLDDDVLVAAAAGIVISEHGRQEMAGDFRRRRPGLRRDFRETNCVLEKRGRQVLAQIIARLCSLTAVPMLLPCRCAECW